MGNCGSGGGGTVRELTEKEKTDIRESWAEFSAGDIVQNGAHLYYKLFKDHPEAKDLFGFGKGKTMSDDDWLKDGQFRSHVKKVFAVLESAVMELDDLTEIGKDLQALGGKHYKYGVTMKQYGHIGQCLLFAFEKKLGDSFTRDRKKAWVSLYAIVEVAMKSGMEHERENSQQRAD